jgi:hypothetical protein
MSYAKPKDAVKSWRERRWRQAGLAKLGLKIEQYEKYLETPHWQAFRKLVFEAQLKRLGRNCCERCQKERNSEGTVRLQVHHLTYERLGNELIEDVEIICRDCHEKEHGRDEVGRARHYAPGYRGADRR